MAREPEAIAALRRALGEKLATFRQAADLTQSELGAQTSYDRSNIGHLEKGRARADEAFWRTADEACKADGTLLAVYFELEAAKAEHEQRGRDQRLAAVRAKAAELRDDVRHEPELPATNRPTIELPVLDDLRRALFGQFPAPALEAAQVKAGVIQAHRLYQLADYDGSARLLPALISQLDASVDTIPHATKTTAYLAAAKLASKVGDTSLAWVTADRCLRAALEAEQPDLFGVATYQVAQALLGDGHIGDAEQTANSAAERLAGTSARTSTKDTMSAQGALLLLLAVISARRGDAKAAKNNLLQATVLAEHIGQDDNRLWTAFGPTNVAIHGLSVRVALGDSQAALRLGETLDTDVLPAALRGRRPQIHLELGWAAAGHGDDSLAVLHLLEAERVAQQAVSRNAMARRLLCTLLAREHKSATPGLRALATRAGAL
ncbi:helix-turn-helix domain-containing protein [Actinocrispum wychmicini]|uniref:Helix-turn-helix protein n=1 Tax=Actinocrispum wychmicini TaxID=1213861 RepID=A0A4R2K1M1_9PSEU|nr:helix-turn-helix transcriptional regulator [Actinocrispum wychmicini]TCO65582.1 helix-turn-helix protein [Actinocrispum wychmicini]